MNGKELSGHIVAAFAKLEASEEELRELDAVVGDGDLGVTIRESSRAIRSSLGQLDPGISPREVLVLTGKTISVANPSTFAALVSIAIAKATKLLNEDSEISSSTLLQFAESAAGALSHAGKSGIGDKTILDALVPSVTAGHEAHATGTDVLNAMTVAAREGIEATKTLSSRKGRAAWAGDRSIGQADAGATAYLRFLEALSSTITTTRNA
ncbi:DAK2 domain-containing protein [Cryobacterium sp. M91]|uniref:DAK2 domain-containing protein n=1 Tax=Cryobacterium sp. M91 TaxID=2048294 RepID=UPI000CE356E1|nr:DAK2 domain-containing protein [Cryobacterium sp. M91]